MSILLAMTSMNRWAARLGAVALAAILLAPSAGAQADRTIKVNVPPTLIGVPGVGVEWRHDDKRTRQVDATISPWITRDGAPAFFVLLVGEQRYFPKGAGQGWYFGLNGGLSVFRFQKWSFFDRTWYQEGFGFVAGGVIGYEHELNERWILDLSAGGGTSQALYKGYDYATGERNDGAKLWNPSGELLPYRLGVTLGYRLGR